MKIIWILTVIFLVLLITLWFFLDKKTNFQNHPWYSLFVAIIIASYLCLTAATVMVDDKHVKSLAILTGVLSTIEIPIVFILFDKILLNDSNKEQQIQQDLLKIQNQLKILLDQNKSIDESLDTIKNELKDIRDNTSKKSFKQMFLSFIKKQQFKLYVLNHINIICRF